MIYCINRIKKEKMAGQRTAGKKAPDDVAKIVKSEFKGEIVPFFEPDRTGNRFIKSFKSYFINIANWKRLLKKIRPGDWIIIQHPYEGAKQGYKKIIRCNKLGAKTIVLIHDISLERKGIDVVESSVLRNMTIKSESEVLKKSHYIICHNEKMKKYLIGRGISEEKIFCLGVFDYIYTGTDIPERRFRKEVCIAGNLSKSKSGYLYKYIEEPKNYVIKMYGPNYDAESNAFVQYKGTLPPDELPRNLEGAFGLVWDGNEIDGCSGVAGEYIRINNPHKCSLYLASNMPVIIWKEAALAEYILKNNLGFVINSLQDIDDVMTRITEQDYLKIIEAVKTVGKPIREGLNLVRVLNEIIDNLM